MEINIENELSFKTSRSGGSGGQNVNKVETQVEANWLLAESDLIDANQKERITLKLKNKINKSGYLMVVSNKYRTQLDNKQDVVKKINKLVSNALAQPKPRKATKPSKAIKEAILKTKKINSFKKSNRQKVII